MSVDTCHSRRRNTPEGLNLQFEYTWDLKPSFILLMYNLQTVVHLILINSYPLTIDSASNRNEYQVYFLGVKAAGALGWQPYQHPVPLSWNLGTLTSWNPVGHSRPVTGLLYLSPHKWIPLCQIWILSHVGDGAVIPACHKFSPPLLWSM
jgi:hypothetical protein